jgi:hypothetical protein
MLREYWRIRRRKAMGGTRNLVIWVGHNGLKGRWRTSRLKRPAGWESASSGQGNKCCAVVVSHYTSCLRRALQASTQSSTASSGAQARRCDHRGAAGHDIGISLFQRPKHGAKNSTTVRAGCLVNRASSAVSPKIRAKAHGLRYWMIRETPDLIKNARATAMRRPTCIAHRTVNEQLAAKSEPG